MKILVVCGMGLGSSHYLLLETIKLVKELEFDAEVDNCDVFTAQSTSADVYIGADYIIEIIEQPGIKIGLEDLLDENELRTKLHQLQE
jgi:PTS system ascorbate-specific IIB component